MRARVTLACVLVFALAAPAIGATQQDELAGSWVMAQLATSAALHATELGLRANVAPYSRAALFEEAVALDYDNMGRP